MTKEYFLKRANKIYLNNNFSFKDLPENFNNKLKIKVICPKHGEFVISVVNFLNGRGCKYCNKEKRDITTPQFIEKAKRIHGDKYDYSKVNYINSYTKVCIICPEHGEFCQTPHGHLKGNGCQKCNKYKHLNGYNNSKLTTSQFIEKAKKVHGDKYDYSKVEYVNCNTKVCIICPEHGEFCQTPSNHLQGKGCPKCVNKQITFDDFKTQIIEKFGNIYDFSRCNFKNLSTEIIVGYRNKFFKVKPTKLLYPKHNKPITHKKIETYKDFVKKAKQVHGDKYNYSYVNKDNYKGTKFVIPILCKKHNEIFYLTPESHLNGNGCKKCHKSKLELQMMNFLNKKNIKYEEQYKPYYLKNGCGQKSLDFYLPEYNIAIECQGIQHFKPIKYWGGEEGFKKQINSDSIKKELLEKYDSTKTYYYIDSHIGLVSIINQSLYNNIYTEDNTFKTLNKLLLSIIKCEQVNRENI